MLIPYKVGSLTAKVGSLTAKVGSLTAKVGSLTAKVRVEHSIYDTTPRQNRSQGRLDY